MKSKGFAILLSLCMSLGACSRGNQGIANHSLKSTDAYETQLGNGNSDEMSLTNQNMRIFEKSMPDADAALQEYLPEGGSAVEVFWDMQGDTVYRFVRLLAQEGWTEGYCLQSLEPFYEKWECRTIGLTDWSEDGTQHYVREASFDRDGRLHFLLDDFEGENYFWAEWTKENGFEVPDVKIQGSLVNADMLLYDKNWYIDSEQRSFLYLNQELKYYNADFTAVEYGNNAMQGWFWQILDTDGGAYVCGDDGGGHFTIWDVFTGEQLFSSNEFGSMHPDGKVIYISEEEAYLCNPTTLSRFSISDGTGEIVLGFDREGYPISRVYGGTIREDGTLVVLAASNEEMRLLEIPKEPVMGDKEELEVAMLYASPFFQALVVDFNKANANYQVVLRLPETNEDWDDFRNRMMAEISNGGGPDLLDGAMLNVKEAAHKEYLMDMTDFCMQHKESIWDAAWLTGEVDGGNYMVPYKCRLWTLVAGEKLVGQSDTWNLKQMEECIGSADCSAVLGSLDQEVLEQESTFYYMGVLGQSRGGFIDWENGISYLNDPQAIRLMEMLKQRPYEGRTEGYGAAIAEGEIPAVMAVVRGIESLQLLAALFQDEEVYIGFPAEAREPNSFLSCDGFVVNRAGAHLEGAQDFLFYLLSEQVQQKIVKKSGEGMLADGLPVDKEALDFFCEYALEGKYVDPDVTWLNSFYGYEYESMALTEENVNRFRNAFENAGAMPDTGDVYSIIGDEAPAYFVGNKSAQEVADIINNRVQLYLDER
ncbi:MAG: extracellular solute-binding protein [Lachnospiraceae bacterium]|nr:extracellular solute-binding protein [Lachnospiraceae bacterium]